MAEPTLSPEQLKRLGADVLEKFDRYAATKNPDSPEREAFLKSERGFNDAITKAYAHLPAGKAIDGVKKVAIDTATALETKALSVGSEGSRIQEAGNTLSEWAGILGTTAASRGRPLIIIGNEGVSTAGGIRATQQALEENARTHALAKSTQISPSLGITLEASSPKKQSLPERVAGINPNAGVGGSQTPAGPSLA
jgi:hypothetical protein